jgi:hypothetical protein
MASARGDLTEGIQTSRSLPSPPLDACTHLRDGGDRLAARHQPAVVVLARRGTKAMPRVFESEGNAGAAIPKKFTFHRTPQFTNPFLKMSTAPHRLISPPGGWTDGWRKKPALWPPYTGQNPPMQ